MNNVFILKRSFAYALAALLAYIVAHYYAHAEKCWIPLTALIVMQTSVGLVLRQGVIRFLEIVLDLVAVSLIIAVLHVNSWLLFPVVVLLFSGMSYFVKSATLNPRFFSTLLIFAFILMAILLLPSQPFNFVYFRLYDVTIGAGMGLLINLTIFPVKVDVEFRKNVIPILNAYIDYFAAILNLLYKTENAATLALQEKERVEQTLQTSSAFFPVWIYEPGISLPFRQGHRHFLIMIERIGQILFSLHHIAKHEFDPLLIDDLKVALTKFLIQAEKILIALTIVMNLETLSEGVSDLTEEVIELESAFNKAIPLTLELIDMSEDYILCAALVAELKDIRLTLIRLGQALRSVGQAN